MTTQSPLGYLPVSDIEDKVERYYQHIDIGSDEADRIVTAVGAHITLMQRQNGKEVTRQRHASSERKLSNTSFCKPTTPTPFL